MKSTNWDDLDFDLNKAYWAHVGHGNAVEVRIKNLRDFFQACDKVKLECFLYGRTLNSAFKNKKIPLIDHDDDLATIKFDKLTLDALTHELVDLGFAIIREEKYILSFVRDKRYIDLCLLENIEGDKLFSGRRTHSKKYFESATSLTINSKLHVLIPKDTAQLLNEMYPSTPTKSIKYKKYLIPKNYYGFLRAKIKKLIKTCKSTPSPTHKKSTQTSDHPMLLSLDDFLNLQVEPEKSFNWRLRAPHLNIVTRKKKYTSVRKIIEYFSENLENLKQEVITTDTSHAFEEPIHIDRRFWQTGNNFFINCIIYGFKKGVVPYTEANDYIKSGKHPLLYSNDYFESLESMSKEEIESFLKNNPIEIHNNCCRGGKHRVFAMIGYYLKHNHYVPFWYEEHE